MPPMPGQNPKFNPKIPVPTIVSLAESLAEDRQNPGPQPSFHQARGSSNPVLQSVINSYSISHSSRNPAHTGGTSTDDGLNPFLVVPPIGSKVASYHSQRQQQLHSSMSRGRPNYMFAIPLNPPSRHVFSPQNSYNSYNSESDYHNHNYSPPHEESYHAPPKHQSHHPLHGPKPPSHHSAQRPGHPSTHSAYTPQSYHSAYKPQSYHSANINQSYHSASKPQSYHSANINHSHYASPKPHSYHQYLAPPKPESYNAPQTPHSHHKPPKSQSVPLSRSTPKQHSPSKLSVSWPIMSQGSSKITVIQPRPRLAYVYEREESDEMLQSLGLGLSLVPDGPDLDTSRGQRDAPPEHAHHKKHERGNLLPSSTQYIPVPYYPLDDSHQMYAMSKERLRRDMSREMWRAHFLDPQNLL